MAHYEHLPIYRSAMKLAIHLETVVHGFSRYVKYTLGSEMRIQSQQIVGLIIKANSQSNRLATLLELRTNIEQLLILARICNETKGFRSFASFAATIELVGQVARQNEGWIKVSGVQK
ncbi:MAG: four helix bundle protein [Trichlorobacter sp.]|jgi:hypothetical protein|nr:four helix bundle protein [Trichlorobacter sp.]